ncbi:MAG: HD-GYP domain-containing protein [Deltaproteobacteria bacterium]|jgi:HD-GYP domain-containing protein (c-di-GMP phosphodiesterase class II)|nr:HD-GYP domain-containing protein [Deltaproteobacteria bacterium]
MLKRILTEQLVPGMYIVDSGLPWLENPYLFSAELEVTAEIIEKIQQEGYTEVFIDTERGQPGASAAYADDSEFAATLADSVPAGNGVPNVPLSEEIDAAKATYVGAFNQAKSFMDGIRRGGKVDLNNAKPLVGEMLKSLGRNPDALLGLCKLRSQDDYTYTHCINVAVLSVMFAKHMGFLPEVQQTAGLAGVFHDLGKALIPLRILNAPRKLSDEEFAIMRKHPALSYDLVRKTSGFEQDVVLGVYEHHERFNGQGYPRGIAGDEISPLWRVLAVADVYDALSSVRPYKQSMLAHRVLGVMYQMRGEDFYPGYVENFIRMLGIYPVGSVVKLEDGRQGVVSGSNSEAPTKPRVLVMRDKKGQPLRPAEYNIRLGECPPIQRCLAAGESSIDPAKALGIS